MKTISTWHFHRDGGGMDTKRDEPASRAGARISLNRRRRWYDRRAATSQRRLGSASDGILLGDRQLRRGRDHFGVTDVELS